MILELNPLRWFAKTATGKSVLAGAAPVAVDVRVEDVFAAKPVALCDVAARAFAAKPLAASEELAARDVAVAPVAAMGVAAPEPDAETSVHSGTTVERLSAASRIADCQPAKAAASKPAKAEESTMSFITDLKTFAAKVEKDLEALWKKAPTLVQVAETTLEYCIPVVETVVGLVGGSAVEAAVTTVLNKAEQDLLAAKGLITSIGATPTVATVLAGVEADLNDMIATAGITNATAVADIKLVVGELDALVNSFTANAAATTTPAA